MKLLQAILLIWPFSLLFAKEPSCKSDTLYCPWAVCYSEHVSEKALLHFNPLILDSHHHVPLEPLKKAGKQLYGYISVGEVADDRPYYAEVKKMGLLLEENPNWPGSYYVDVRQEGWTRLVLDRLIPDILTQGFTGIFLDTLDNPIYLEQQDPIKYEGMIQAAADLVQLMRIYFPTISIILNRAYVLVDDVGRAINGLLAESLYTSYNFETKSYFIHPKEQYEKQVEQIHAIQKQFPKLKVFSLDYWDPKDTGMVKEIYRIERSNKIRPYVSTVDLKKVYQEPR